MQIRTAHSFGPILIALAIVLALSGAAIPFLTIGGGAYVGNAAEQAAAITRGPGTWRFSHVLWIAASLSLILGSVWAIRRREISSPVSWIGMLCIAIGAGIWILACTVRIVDFPAAAAEPGLSRLDSLRNTDARLDELFQVLAFLGLTLTGLGSLSEHGLWAAGVSILGILGGALVLSGASIPAFPFLAAIILATPRTEQVGQRA